MAAKFFGEYLIAENLITQQILDDVLKIQQESNRMLGEIAVSMGLLTEKEVSEINLTQQVQNKRFGEIAEDLGLLQPEQLGDLLLKQQRQRKYFGSILVDLGLFTNEEVEIQLQAHENEKNQAYQSMLKEIEDHPLAEYLIAGINSSRRLFVRTLHEQCGFCQLLHQTDLDDPQFQNLQEVACQISMGSSHALSVTMATCIETAAIIASEFTFQPIEDCDPDFSTDAFGEFLNIIVGQLLDRVSVPDSANRTATRSNVNIMELCEQSESHLIAEMNSQIGHFMVVISKI